MSDETIPGAIITLSEFIRNLAFNENWRGY